MFLEPSEHGLEIGKKIDRYLGIFLVHTNKEFLKSFWIYKKTSQDLPDLSWPIYQEIVSKFCRRHCLKHLGKFWVGNV